MKYALIFRSLKNVKYSFAPLIASLEKTDLLQDIDILFVKKIDQIKEYDGEYAEIIVAFSFMTFDLDQIITDLTDLRKLNLKTPYSTIAGGPHISGDPKSGQTLGFDSIFPGDGEATIRQYCADLLAGHRKKIYDGTLHPIDLNDYPPFPTHKDHLMFIPIEITRGCPFGCKYCATSYIAGRKIRDREIDQIIEYLAWSVPYDKLMARFITPNAFGYSSPNGVRPNLDILEKLFFRIRQVGIKQLYFGSFPSEVRPESVTPEVLKLITKYCDNQSLVIGIQSGSEEMLKRMKRGHTLEDGERAISLTRKFGIEPLVDFIFGLPGETPQDRRDTLNWMTRINRKYGARIHAHVFMPLVGSPWANTETEPLDPKTLSYLGRFAQEQRLYGQWFSQQKLAKKVQRWKQMGLINPPEHD